MHRCNDEKKGQNLLCQGPCRSDVAKELVLDITIMLPNGNTREQHVIYDNLPKFCSGVNYGALTLSVQEETTTERPTSCETICHSMKVGWYEYGG